MPLQIENGAFNFKYGVRESDGKEKGSDIATHRQEQGKDIS